MAGNRPHPTHPPVRLHRVCRPERLAWRASRRHAPGNRQCAAASLDSALSQFNLDAIVAPTDSPGWTTDLILSDHFIFASSGLAGGPGYPIINVPAANVLGMPMGISFLGTAFSEPTLIKIAAGFEAVTHARFQPTFTGNVTTANTNGTNLTPPPPPKKDSGLRPHHM